MSACPTVRLPLRSFCWSETVVPSVQAADGSRACAATTVCVPAALAMAELLHARIHALVTENRRLLHRNRLLAVALDDALDRACAHALCCDNEQLLNTAHTDHPSCTGISIGFAHTAHGFAAD